MSAADVKLPRIVILGMGCTLLSDQGLGVEVLRALDRRILFPEQVTLVDGGTVGVHLLGTLAQAELVIAIDVVAGGGAPGSIYRLEGQQILDLLKKPLHVLQEAFIEALIHCQLLDRPPRTVLLGIEPTDTERLACGLTPLLHARTDEMAARVLSELQAEGVPYVEKQPPGASGE